MARVRLNAGALTAAQVRMGSRGASERLRPPGDDINSSRDRDDKLVCTWCGSTKKVDASRPRRCVTCRADEQAVRDASARLKAAGQPPLGSASGNKTQFANIRKQGDAAQKRLAGRKRAAPRSSRVHSPSPAPTSSSPRRLNAAQKAAGARRLQNRLEQMEKKLTALPPGDKRRDRLREDILAARRLSSDWQEGVH